MRADGSNDALPPVAPMQSSARSSMHLRSLHLPSINIDRQTPQSTTPSRASSFTCSTNQPPSFSKVLVLPIPKILELCLCDHSKHRSLVHSYIVQLQPSSFHSILLLLDWNPFVYLKRSYWPTSWRAKFTLAILYLVLDLRPAFVETALVAVAWSTSRHENNLVSPPTEPISNSIHQASIQYGAFISPATFTTHRCA